MKRVRKLTGLGKDFRNVKLRYLSQKMELEKILNCRIVSMHVLRGCPSKPASLTHTPLFWSKIEKRVKISPSTQAKSGTHNCFGHVHVRAQDTRSFVILYEHIFGWHLVRSLRWFIPTNYC